ncbi:MAG: hypothetical protein B7Z42_15600 [Brevundimonas sp. 12-68-7]|nr:MAG: hypothetical protein B7Z42_15600 [Brevundimonas sp. 12-68-7]
MRGVSFDISDRREARERLAQVMESAPVGLLIIDSLGRIALCNAQIERTYGFCPAGNEPRHPSQLYEAGLEGIVLFVVLWLAVWKWKLLTKPGYVMGLFLVGYGLSRAAIETVREPDSHMPEALQGVITMGMLLSIPMILVGAWLIWRARSRPPVTAA